MTHRSEDNAESKLGYGQIVSLFVWAPVGVDFVYTVLYGSKEGLESKIPVPFLIVEDTDPDHAPRLR
ncbi:hypothetical protein CPB86DRAFT_814116 [Serendipita vermifera]|nr:hypothetical protein CPB86DRAFT_814116 [Serendipita vermifera]